MELMNIVYEQDWEFARETSNWMWLVKITDPTFEHDKGIERQTYYHMWLMGI